MFPLVLDQVRPLGERFGALVALERLLPGVLADVDDQAGTLGKCLGAELATVRTLAGVLALVVDEA